AQYSLPAVADFNLVTRVDYSGKGDMYWHIDNLDKQKPVHLVNARIALENDHYQLMFYAENLFKEKYVHEFVAMEWSGAFNDVKYPGTPRRYGIRGTVRF
ncbi:MAG TPA: TonB-dependent receptor, partial [Sphingomonadales bacterium]